MRAEVGRTGAREGKIRSTTMPLAVDQDDRKNVVNPACPPGGGLLRLDEYLSDPNQCELGIKRRGGKKGVEVKGLVTHAEQQLAAGPFVGPIEIW
jgi:hypothetical protein